MTLSQRDTKSSDYCSSLSFPPASSLAYTESFIKSFCRRFGDWSSRVINFVDDNIFLILQWNQETKQRKSLCCAQEISRLDGCIHSKTKHEIKITLNIFMIVVFFMICWLPLNVIKTVRMLCQSCTVQDDLITFGIVLTHFNSAVNPLMYAYHLKDFRHSILVLIGRRQREPSISFWSNWKCVSK